MHFPSRPQWGTLVAQETGQHLFVVDKAGAQAVLDLASSVKSDWFSNASIVCIGSANTKADFVELQVLNPLRFFHAPDLNSALPRLRKVFNDSSMGLHVYFAGAENFLDHAMQIAVEAQFDHRAVQTEWRGSLARRVQCVHCKGISEEVRTQPFQCHHCGLWLLVRDHFSRRVGAYQGVNINAEDPGIAPTDIQEVFV